jgi:glycerol-3-phosphate dehydrogenase
MGRDGAERGRYAALIGGLARPDPRAYWGDFLASVLALYLAFGVLVWGPLPWAGRLAPRPACSVLAFRCGAFLHEVVHQGPGRLPGFGGAYNLLSGYVFKLPSFLYTPHLEHHATWVFSTEHQGNSMGAGRGPGPETARPGRAPGACPGRVGVMSVETDERGRALAALAGPPFDLLVIGGGIVGAGVARDAAARGLRTLLLERSDFAAGTSSRSSRLLHGGLRYLAQGRLGLVREASVEKMRLSRIAPHLCQPLPFLFPSWEGSGWPLWQLALGVRLYDLLCGGRNLGDSATLDAAELRRLLPGLRREGLAGGTRHYDAMTNDARLVIDTLRSAAAAGATLRNYAAFVSASPAGAGWTCSVRDEDGGAGVEVTTRAIVNAAGAWASRLPRSGLRLRLTKGAHAVIDRARLPVAEAVVLPAGKRVLFVIPWGQRLILGTTDTDFEGDPADVRADPEDVRSILVVVNAAFPAARLGPGDVIATWAGVRPLIAPRHHEAGAPSDISRRHVIREAEPGWFDVAGGKLTTYRLMAEQTVDRVGRLLGRRLPPSPTAAGPLRHSPFSGVLPPPVEPAVVTECCRREWAVHLDDVLLRRTSWHYYHRNSGEIAARAVRWMAELLGWDRDRRAAELRRYREAVGSLPLDLPAPG